MGKKKADDAFRKTSFSHIRMTRAFREYMDRVRETAGDEGDTALIKRLVIKEGKRLKLPPPPSESPLPADPPPSPRPRGRRG